MGPPSSHLSRFTTARKAIAWALLVLACLLIAACDSGEEIQSLPESAPGPESGSAPGPPPGPTACTLGTAELGNCTLG